jgi:hypothetical protein
MTKQTKRNAIWFSRHQPTVAQLAEISAMGWQLCKLEDGLRLGAMNLQDDGDVHDVGYALLALAAKAEADAIIGVWTAPMQEVLARTAQDCVQLGEWRGVPCYAAWNTSRAQEGGKPVFEHRRFCCVGRLHLSALRWSIR